MSYVTTYDIFCDGEGCAAWDEAGARTKRQAQASAKRHGWSISNAGHFCPNCKDTTNDQ